MPADVGDPSSRFVGILLFDGECGLCSRLTRFVARRDPRGRIAFASLQSEVGRRFLERHAIASDVDTAVYVEGDRAWVRSGAILRTVRRLRLPWPILFAFVAVPSFLRDAVYRFVARHRYGWFGRHEHCGVPTPEFRARFIADD